MEIVLASMPVHGHVNPLLGVADGLVDAGHRVRFLTGARFAAAVTSTGAEHVALPAAADFDDRTWNPFEDLVRPPTGLAALRLAVDRIFLARARDQHRALLALLEERRADVVLAEPGFVGAGLLAGDGSRTLATRPPPVVGIGVIPLLLASRDVAPYGLGLAPLRGRLNRPRNTVLRLLVEQVAFRGLQGRFERLYTEVVGRPPGTFLFDAASLLDAVVQLSVPAFEYPRSDVRVPLHFAGTIPSRRPPDDAPPPWWDELVRAPCVVHVTQGTLANDDLGRLVRPTLDALADEDVLVVVTTGGPEVASVGPLPANARAAVYVAYDRLLPHVDVVVTNGGYGGVQQALAHGLPLVVAGETEDKREVAARVAWTGAGLNLRNQRPSPRAIRTAVRAVLREPGYRAAAAQLATDMAVAGGITTVLRVIDEVVAAHPR